MIADRIPELKKLTPQEKLALAGELWDEVAAAPDSLPPRQDHVRILEERMAEYKRNPRDVSLWTEVKQRILSSPLQKHFHIPSYHPPTIQLAPGIKETENQGVPRRPPPDEPPIRQNCWA